MKPCLLTMTERQGETVANADLEEHIGYRLRIICTALLCITSLLIFGPFDV